MEARCRGPGLSAPGESGRTGPPLCQRCAEQVALCRVDVIEGRAAAGGLCVRHAAAAHLAHVTAAAPQCPRSMRLWQRAHCRNKNLSAESH